MSGQSVSPAAPSGQRESVSPAASNGITPLQQMVASCSGAILTSLLVTPLDVVKIRLQVQKNPFPKGKCFVYCNGLMDHICVCENGNSRAWYNKPPGHFTGTLDAFIKIVRVEGVRSLWSGLPPTLVMAVPATVIYFTCYDQLCAVLRTRMGEHADTAPLVAGAVARVGSVTVISPLELMRTRLQSQRQSYGQLRGSLGQAVQAGGWGSLWRGLGPTLLRDVPFSALYWYNYERIKAWLLGEARDPPEKHRDPPEKLRDPLGQLRDPLGQLRDPLGQLRDPPGQLRDPYASFSITFISGALSGSIAAVATLPFDVVKTKRQTVNLSSQVSSSSLSVMRRIVTEDGVRGLFKGFLPRLVKVAPACAIMISTYEFGKAFFRRLNQQRPMSPSDPPTD